MQEHELEKPPTRALVSRYIANPIDGAEEEGKEVERPILVITTGRGKVRAGIFSRRHLMITGMGPATALPLVKEARKRNMHMILVDPNVHGERFGFDVFKRTWNFFFPLPEKTSCCNAPVCVLAHSMAGSQLVRCLDEMTKQHTSLHFQQRIKSVVFTDSTHTIKWSKDNAWLCYILEASVYFSSLNRHFKFERVTPPGTKIEVDDTWKLRFGDMETVSAGTLDHSLTNYYARSKIWEHFEKVLL